MSDRHFIYVSVDAPQCKIGFTKNPAKREIWLYNPCHFPRRLWKPVIRRIWPVGDISVARQVERAVIIALSDRRAAKSSPEWFEIDWREMYNTVDACILREAGRAIPGISSWRLCACPKLTWKDREAILGGKPFTVATLRRLYR
jgi:hypothetical protein